MEGDIVHIFVPKGSFVLSSCFTESGLDTLVHPVGMFLPGNEGGRDLGSVSRKLSSQFHQLSRPHKAKILAFPACFPRHLVF